MSSDAFDPGATMPAEISPGPKAGSKRAAYHLTLERYRREGPRNLLEVEIDRQSPGDSRARS